LAVLPLENLSGDSSQEYFADGMTDALISNLSQIKDLKVISRTSVMRFKGSREPLPDIAKALGVDAVIEGSVLKAGDRVRVTAQLIHAATDAHMWAQNYDRDLSDILKLQSDVAQEIATEVRAKLTKDEQNRLASSERIDPRAHQAYLLGKFHLAKNSEEDISRSISYFQQAIEIEPNYADAHAGLAAAWLDRGIWGGSGLSGFESRVRAEATTAISIDPVNANAHIAMCQLLNNYDYNWTGAEEEAKRAIEIDPNSTAALEAYSWLLQSLGRHAEVRPLMERAELLDPVSARIQSSFGRMLYRARRYEEAETHLKRSIELDPTNYANYGRLGDVYIEMGRFDEAISQFEKSASLQPEGAHSLRLSVVYARMGEGKKALEIMARISNRPAWEVARLYTALGETNKAFEALDGALNTRDTLLVHIKEDPSFDRLHSDPRWKPLLRRLNFPEE
jgi:TolB-like protein/lipopolysaccharide biosynthesis regulator YciM